MNENEAKALLARGFLAGLLFAVGLEFIVKAAERSRRREIIYILPKPPEMGASPERAPDPSGSGRGSF